jgi:hypothetical protein
MSSNVLHLFKYPLEKFDDCLSWINNYTSHTHMLRTGLKRGKWHETEDQILHGCMEALVDFVEIQQAWMEAICDKDIYKTLPWWIKFSVTRAFIPWRSSELGLQRLEWERNLRYAEDGHTHDPNGKLSNQALSAQEQYELYTWWKERATRVEPYDLEPGMARAKLVLCYPHIEPMYPDEPAWSMLENAYFREETENLCRLMKIRNHLWT